MIVFYAEIYKKYLDISEIKKKAKLHTTLSFTYLFYSYIPRYKAQDKINYVKHGVVTNFLKTCFISIYLSIYLCVYVCVCVYTLFNVNWYEICQLE